MAFTYKYLAVSANKFVEQVVRHANSGHTNYVTGVVPRHKDPLVVDRKLIAKFHCDRDRNRRSRAKLAGIASVHYVRHDRHWVLMATVGVGPFYDEHAAEYGQRHQFRSLERQGFCYAGYRITRRRGPCGEKLRTLVSLDPETYRNVKGRLLDLATRRSVQALEAEFWQLGFEPYSPVRKQLFAMVRGVNRRRKQRGFQPVDWRKCVRTRRRITKGGVLPGGVENVDSFTHQTDVAGRNQHILSRQA